MVSKKIKDILNATPVNVMCTKRMSCKAQKILIFQSEELSILFKEIVFEALLCNLGCVTFTILKFENASYKYKKTFFGPVNFVKKSTFSNIGLFQSPFLSVTCKKKRIQPTDNLVL